MADAHGRQLPLDPAGRHDLYQRDGPREPGKSREIYDWVRKVCTGLGALDADMVPFEKYAKAAEGLASPSSAARALFDGAEHIERVDCLIRRIARQQGLQSDTLDEIVTLVDERLAKNRADRAAKRN